jgi:antitoxin (DNA-binding transcriptional repressor) of toxin-antitoxin stability system
MKLVELEQANLDVCVNDAQRERVVITRNGKPVALIVGVEGMDEEQLELGSSDKFWTLIEKRRKEKTISRAELEQKIDSRSSDQKIQEAIEPTKCTKCGASLVQLNVPHVERLCTQCGKNQYVVETDENGEGIKIGEGDRLIIPAGWMRLSLDPNLSTGRFLRPGLNWFVRNLLFTTMPSSPDDLLKTLEYYNKESYSILKNSALLADLNLEDEEDGPEFMRRIENQSNLPEWWAALLNAASNHTKKVLEDKNSDASLAAWLMHRVTITYAMLIFARDLEEYIWKGYRLNYLYDALNEWENNKHNDSEEFWQKTLSRHSFVLSQVFSLPVVIIQKKAYLGGKGIDNSGGKIVDFLIQNDLTKNLGLVEIKTPKTLLLGKEYRSGIYSASSDITGAIIQASSYKDTILKDYSSLRTRSTMDFEAFSPQSLIVAGNFSEEIDNPEKRASFELFRSTLQQVQIITYDELFAKVKTLLKLLEGDV